MPLVCPRVGGRARDVARELRVPIELVGGCVFKVRRFQDIALYRDRGVFVFIHTCVYVFIHSCVYS
jgi:hypothetical protein